MVLLLAIPYNRQNLALLNQHILKTLLKTLLNGYYKNGSSIQDQREIETRTDSPLYEYTLNKSIILDLSASDYIEFYIKPQTTDSSATNIRSGSSTNLMTFFQGFKIGA